MKIRVEVVVPILDRVLAQCDAIGAALERGCFDIDVIRCIRADGAWTIGLAAEHPHPRGEVLYIRTA